MERERENHGGKMLGRTRVKGARRTNGGGGKVWAVMEITE